jgi:thiol:disulfide interchange protein DsbA
MMMKRFALLGGLLLALAGCGEAPAPEEGQSLEAAAAAEAAAQAAAAVPAAAGDDAAPVLSMRFQLGTHYRRLSPTQPTSSSPEQVEVAEVFWYGCPHCRTFDPYLQSWQTRKAEYVNFVRIPAVWNPLVRLHARAFYTAEALGKSAEMHDAFFTEMHVNGNSLESEAKLQAFFAGFGVDPAAFKTAFDSFDVHRMVQRADELSRRYEIASVPTIVVNGKYVTDGGMAGGYEPLLELVDELAATERGAN